MTHTSLPTDPWALRLLLVEDDEVDVLAVRRALFRAGLTASLVAVDDGAKALDWLRRAQWGEVQVLITDLDLPHLGGLALIRALREDFTLHDLGVIILTHRDDPDARAEAERLGVTSYLLKPLEPSALLAALRRLAHRP